MQLNRAVYLFIAISLLCITSMPVSAFNFSQDIAAKFFWTESYKKAHPTPTNHMPKSMTEYYRRAKETAESDKKIPNPQFSKDEKLVDTPNPDISIQKYNNTPGKMEINLNSLIKTRKVNSIGVVSPLYNIMAYTTVYYYPETKSAASELYLLPLDTTKTLQNRIESAHVNHGKKTIYKTGMDALDLDIYKTLTIVDWSSDGNKLAFKEKISHSADGLWKTSLFVYDSTTGVTKNLTEIREAIRYYWQKHESLQLSDYRWDIYPIGWDALNPDRIIVFAYAFTDSTPKFLGAWSIDYLGNRSMLMSLEKTNFEISQNGLCLRAKYN